MRRKIFSALCAFLLTVPAMHAQWVVTDPGNLAQGIVNSVNEMVETSETAQNAMSTFKEASKIYEQSRKYYDMLKSVNSLVSGSLKVKESVLMLSEISESYVTNYGKMLTDENYTQRELEAIDKGVLCRYYYYPHVVRLTMSEMEEYMRISVQLAKFFNNNHFADSNEILTALLLKRKRIIHKAENKLEVFRNILEQRFQEKGNLKYTLVYVPEGLKPDTADADVYDDTDQLQDDDYSEKLINEYTAVVSGIDSKVTVRKFTSGIKEREELLKGFADGNIEVLTSMKCLDEGVDVPRSELAIFCASTGNPRQFIQRRGRILRKHPDKHMAVIHDLVVAPEVNIGEGSYAMERSLMATELRRVRNFSLLSENSDDTINELEDIMNYYNLSLF